MKNIDKYSLNDFINIIKDYKINNLEYRIDLFINGEEKYYIICSYLDYVTFGVEDSNIISVYPDIFTLLDNVRIRGVSLLDGYNKIEEVYFTPEPSDYLIKYKEYSNTLEDRLGNKYQLYKIVKREIDSWNPFCLLPDAPLDEFACECEDIVKRINNNSTVEFITEVIADVFTRSFNEDFSAKDTLAIAVKIKNRLEKIK